MTHAEVASRLEWSASKVSRIETGQSRAQTGDVADLLELYGVTDDSVRKAYVQLAREARRRGWWTRYSDVLGSGTTYIGLESEAAAIQTFEPQNVPGLLQNEGYARASIQGGLVRPDPDEVERRVRARMERQELLERANPPQIWAVLDEAVIRRPVGGAAVMRDQLQHLVDITTRPNANVTVQVLPMALGSHPGMNGAFVLLGFPDPQDRPVVYLETATDGLYLEETPDIERYTLMFKHLVARALGPDESRAMIIEIVDQLA